VYKIKSEALGQKVHKALRTMIINGELRPGQKLIQDNLAERLGISRTPLLAAFSRLEQENLVVTIPRRGVYVKQYTGKELLDICNIRIRLESLGAREAALAATPDDIYRLEAALEEFDRAVVKNEESLLKQADYNYHMEILHIGKNKFLHDILYSYTIIVINMSGLMRYVELSKADHHDIFAAIKSKDPEKTEALMIKHTERPRQFINIEK
jgi:DNA-binding GntR family transcriptional regulator